MCRAVLLNIVDLVTVAAHFRESMTSAAPQIPNTRHVDQIEDWVRKARTADDGSETFRRGIEILESLLRAIVPDTAALLPNCPNRSIRRRGYPTSFTMTPTSPSRSTTTPAASSEGSTSAGSRLAC